MLKLMGEDWANFLKEDKKLQHVPLEKLIVMTAGPGNIPHTPKQQAANGKDYVEE